jgi:hypothetical protein
MKLSFLFNIDIDNNYINVIPFIYSKIFILNVMLFATTDSNDCIRQNN